MIAELNLRRSQADLVLRLLGLSSRGVAQKAGRKGRPLSDLGNDLEEKFLEHGRKLLSGNVLESHVPRVPPRKRKASRDVEREASEPLILQCLRRNEGSEGICLGPTAPTPSGSYCLLPGQHALLSTCEGVRNMDGASNRRCGG